MKEFEFVHKNEGETSAAYGLRRKEAWAQHYASLTDEEKKIVDDRSETTLNYFESEDPSGRWTKECCELSGTCELSKLYESWLAWCDKEMEHSGTQRKFVSMLENRRLQRLRASDGKVFYTGISLK